MLLNMKELLRQFRISMVIAALCAGAVAAAQVEWTEAKLLDHIKGGLAGKVCGNSICIPWENTDPDPNRVPREVDFEEPISPCQDDDEFAQVPFIRTCESKMNGADGVNTATMQEYGAAFKVAPGPFWCGNFEAQEALKNGVQPPYSGGWPQNGAEKNSQPEAIDWQIECNWIGWSLPLMPATAVAINDSCGHVIGYASGLYAGRFFVTMESIAPLYTNIVDIVKAAAKSVPVGSDIRMVVDTLIDYHSKHPAQTEYWNAYQWVHNLPGVNDGFQGSRAPCAIVTIALLYSNNDIQKAVENALRMGADADCNCGASASVLGSMLGYSNLPDAWKAKVDQFTGSLDGGCKFQDDYTFLDWYTSMQNIAKKAIVQNGGSFSNGVYTIMIQDVPPPTSLEIRGDAPTPLEVTVIQRRSFSLPAIQGDNQVFGINGRLLANRMHSGVVIQHVRGKGIARQISFSRQSR